MIIKSDGEGSIEAVRTAVAKYHGGRIVTEGPARGESASNGLVEQAGQLIREYARVFKEQIEEKSEVMLESKDIIMQWVLRWAALVCSRYVVGADGRTAYQRRRGRPCKVGVVPIGEKVHFKRLKDTKQAPSKFNSQWSEGIWLGHARNTNEVLIGTTERGIESLGHQKNGTKRQMGCRTH